MPLKPSLRLAEEEWGEKPASPTAVSDHEDVYVSLSVLFEQHVHAFVLCRNSIVLYLFHPVDTLLIALLYVAESLG